MKYILAAAFLSCTLHGFAQFFPSTDYPRDYFRNPLAIPMSLAANFGELRPNHYHMGLDIRTQHRENLPVFAAADGYVARVSVEPGGFGQAIYIYHPNGYTTVYGHLNKFFPALAAYVHDQQYRRQSWQVSLELPPSLFPVKKGDLIAYSGNTGGSQGPHLHFEIRRTAGDVNLNPLLFGLPVPDNTAPSIQRIAWYDRNQGIYEQSPHFVPVAVEARGVPGPAGHAAIASKTAHALVVVNTPRISFALSGFDTQSGSANPNGIYEAGLFVDDTPVIGFQMNNISYDHTRNINAHIDYKTRETGGPFLQQLFFLSGYPAPSIYSVAGGGGDPAKAAVGSHPADGVVRLDDGRVHAIRIEVKDTQGNVFELRFRVQYKPGELDPRLNAPSGNADINGGTGVRGDVEMVRGGVGKKFYAGMVDGIETADYAFFLGEKSLYDSVTIRAAAVGYPGSGLSLRGGVSPVYTIGAPWVPLLDPVLVRLRPIGSVPVDSLPAAGGAPGSVATDRVVMVCFNGASRDVQRPQWQDGWASARFREFGNFQLVEDREAPVISCPGMAPGADLSKATRIVVSVKDNLGATRGFRAELDPPAGGGGGSGGPGGVGGQWLCFTNDKGLSYIYTFEEHCPPGKHVLRITVRDEAGNVATKEIGFTR